MKKAFLVGINDYKPAGYGGQDLSGCVNDVRDMADTLFICGFAAKSIRICTDRRATKSGIEKGLMWLVSGAKAGDSLVFYYSGHGSQVVDIDADEIDHKDEILCPHDLDFYAKTYISDDTLNEIFARLPAGVNLEVILDCCHSGTATREIDSPKTRERYIQPPFDFSFYMEYEPDIAKRKIIKIQKDNPGKINHVLWSACRDNQTSEETDIGGNVRGVFTYYFCKILRKVSGNISRKELKSLLAAAVRRVGFSQSLQLACQVEEIKVRPFA